MCKKCVKNVSVKCPVPCTEIMKPNKRFSSSYMFEKKCFKTLRRNWQLMSKAFRYCKNAYETFTFSLQEAESITRSFHPNLFRPSSLVSNSRIKRNCCSNNIRDNMVVRHNIESRTISQYDSTVTKDCLQYRFSLVITLVNHPQRTQWNSYR